MPVALFLHSWLPWRMSFLNLRNHKKLLIVDGKTGFTGGMNISDRHVGGDRPPAVRDTMVRLDGPVVRQMMESFALDWEFVAKEELKDEGWWARTGHSGPALMRAIMSGPDEDVALLEEHWASAIELAASSVRIVTPYFLPEDRVLDVLVRATLRGVSVEILIPEHSNHFYMDWAVRAHLDGMPLDRIICHLAPSPFDHSKLMTVDGGWCSFGSSNWDARSMRLNFEMTVESYDRALTAEIDAVISRKLIGAKRLTQEDLAARRPIARLRDASARLLLPLSLSGQNRLRLISWNLYYRRGAAAADIAALIEQYRPDLFIMQEALDGIEAVPRLAAGSFHSLPWIGKRYGLAAWLPDENADITTVDLPYSRLPASFPPRRAQVIRFSDLTIANVHLSHGQFLNRRQLRRISEKVSGPLAIVGDFNMIGRIVLRGFQDLGPRGTTHYAQKLVPLRLDRCVARGLDCIHAEILDRGPSDHRPILIDLATR